MKVFLKYAAWTLVIIVLLIGGAFAYLLSNKDQIREYALNGINEQLTVKLNVDEIDLTLFSQFPKVSLDLQRVSISDRLRPKQHLLRAEHVYIGFNLYDIIRKNYTIKLITIDKGNIDLYTNKKGISNYSIFKEQENPGKNETFLLSLNEVKMNGVEVDYVDERYQQYHSALFKMVSLYGDFNEKGENIGLKGDLLAHQLKSDDIILARNKPLKLDVVFKTDHRAGTYTFERGYVDIDRLKLSLTGKIINKPKSVYFDLETSARNLDIPSLLSILPVQSLPQDLKGDGDLFLSGTIKGEASDKLAPAIHFNFGVTNGTLQKGNGLALKQINFKGEFSNGAGHNKQSSLVSLTDLSFMLKDAQITGKFMVTNFADPLLTTSLKGKINADDLINFMQNETLKSAEGMIDFDIDFSGKTSNLNQSSWLSNKSSGRVVLELTNITFKQNDKSIKRLSAQLSLENKNALIENFEAEFAESDIKISGTLNNIIPYLLLADQPLEANIKYQSNNIDLNNFVMPLSPTNMDENKKGFALPENIVIDAEVKATQLVYNLFKAKNVSAAVRWKGKKITVENLVAQTMNGQLKLDGEIENARDGRFMASVTSTLNNIDINALFKACNDFGQQEITNKHIQGKLSGTIDLVSVWSNNLDCDLGKLYALCNVDIKNGELNGYKPLEALGKYVDVKELQNLKFADLKNTIEIRNKTIYIPAFDVKNNALNMTLSGTHTLDNFIDYKVKIKLSELLKNRRKATVNEFNEEETADGGMNLYLTMKGPIDNFKIAYDKKEVKQQLKQDLKKEKQSIKEILKKEFTGDEEKKKDIKEKKNDNDELEFEPE
ncbi:MAG: AsmA-like C-terminal region-containing protein [Bacteroidota bacterium]